MFGDDADEVVVVVVQMMVGGGGGGADDGGRLEMVKPTCPQELLPCHRFPPSAQMLYLRVDCRVCLPSDMIFVTCITCSACVKLSALG